MKTYQLFLERLKQARNIYFGDKKYNNIFDVPELSLTINCVSTFYQLQDLRPDIFCDDEGYHISFLKPKSKTDLQKKRTAYRRVANENFGFLSRTPDFINAALTACAINYKVFGRDDNTDYSENILQYYEYCKRNHIFITHASINPQIDRSRSISQVNHKNSAVRVASYDKEGITVSGAKMIGTLVTVADEILIFNMPGLTEQDSDYALAFGVQTTSKDIDIISRKSMLKKNASPADYPISSFLDTMDSMVIFNNTKISWDRVFIFKNVKMSNAFYDITHARNHTGHQGIVRMLSVIELLCGIATELAENIGLSSHFDVRDRLGEITTTVELIKGVINLSEENAQISKEGFIAPNIHAIQAARYHVAKVYGRIVDIIQSLAPGSMNSSPPVSYFDYKLKGADADERNILLYDKLRVIIMNLAWDLTGTEIGQRQKLFEMFNSGDPKLIGGNHYLNYNMENSKFAVSKILSSSIINCVSLACIKDGNILLIKTKSSNIWYFAGGKVEKFEEPREALLREVKEELSVNMNLNELKFLCTLFGASHDSSGLVSLTIYSGEINDIISPNNEIEEVKWFEILPQENFAPLVNEFIKRLNDNRIKL